MRGPGILWMLQVGAGLSMAGPMFVVGVEFLRTGQVVLGVGFLLLGTFALFFPSYLVRRIGGPRTWIRRRLGRSDDGDEERGESEGKQRANLLDRFRDGDG